MLFHRYLTRVKAFWPHFRKKRVPQKLHPRWKLFVFDWDGTIMDTTTIIVEEICRTCEVMGYTVPDVKNVRHAIGLGREDTMRTLVPECPETKWEEFEEIYRTRYIDREASVEVFPRLTELLYAMKKENLRLAIATGKSDRGIARVFKKTGFAPLFEAVRTGFNSKPKPDPTMLFEISKETGVPIKDMVMIGDSKYDLLMAKNAGCDAIAVLYGATEEAELKKHKAVAYVRNIEELARALGVEALLT